MCVPSTEELMVSPYQEGYAKVISLRSMEISSGSVSAWPRRPGSIRCPVGSMISATWCSRTCSAPRAAAHDRHVVVLAPDQAVLTT